MNPYQEIQNLDKLIDSLEQGLTYSRNKPKDTANINTLINARNCFEEMLNCKYHTDVVETMIYDKIYSLYLENDIANGNDLNETNKSLMYYFDNMFSLGSDAKKHLVIEELKMYVDSLEQSEGNWTDETPDEEKKAYILERDSTIDRLVAEKIIKIKSLIAFKLK
jgi:hypothetical protein